MWKGKEKRPFPGKLLEQKDGRPPLTNYPTDAATRRVLEKRPFPGKLLEEKYGRSPTPNYTTTTTRP
ncbi:MAG: hypothetical protein GY805_12520 [Chloroflexi bacterium]|nr:hypothetical protein [Chloroflexota bacterium]